MTFDDLKRRSWPAASAEPWRWFLLVIGFALPISASHSAEQANAPEAFLEQELVGGGLQLPRSVQPNDPPDVVEVYSPVPAETGLASWYGPGFHRRKTASGERFDMFAMTAAHRTLAFGTLICVRSQITGRGVVVRVNDRGPRVPGRVVDLSRAAAIELGLHGLGLKPVDVVPLTDGQSTCKDKDD